MDTKEALRIVSRQGPCPHDNADTTLGNGKVWAKCEDCGVTFPQEYWENAREAAKRFDDALEVISTAIAMTPNDLAKPPGAALCDRSA
mgnify:CR=1 FL=1